MKRITIVSALAALVVLAALAVISTTSKHTVPAVYASPASGGCSAATLNGSYGFIQPAGFTTLHNSSEVPWQFVGVETFDGSVGTSVSFTSAVNGAISPNQTATGTYHVNPDCTGTISFGLQPSLPTGYAANIVIIGGGAEVFAISAGTGDTATAILKKQ